MYTNIYYNRQDKLIHLWDDIKGYFKFPYEQYYYEKVPYNTELKSIFGDNVVKRKGYTEDLENTFERDINPEMRILVDLYYESDDVAKNKILFIDIETDSKKGYPNIQDPDKEILSIACRDYNERKTYVFVLDKNNKFTLTNTEDTFFNVVNREYLLLQNFITFIKNRKYTVISGYNSQYFDLPYIIRRCRKIIPHKVNELSPIDLIVSNDFDGTEEFEIVGLNHLDWLLLYKKYAQGSRVSWSLDNIALLEIKTGKKKYKGTLAELYESSINDFILYNIEDTLLLEKMEDKLRYLQIAISTSHKGHIPYKYIFQQSKIIDGAIQTYAKRNSLVLCNKPNHGKSINNEKIDVGKINNWKEIKDLIFIEEIEKDRQYDINIDDIPEDYTFNITNTKDPSKIIILSKNNMQTLIDENNVKISSIGRMYLLPNLAKGAYVKNPIKGIHKWIVDLDATSLYPSIIRTLNISPETKVAVILDWTNNKNENHISLFELYVRYMKGDDLLKDIPITLIKKEKKIPSTFEALKRLCKEHQFSVSCNGVIYKLSHRGIIPNVLDLWFKERDTFKKLSKKHKKEGNEALAIEYDIKQYVMKILLNSTYGALLLPSFRMYDKDNGEAVTYTGRELIRFSEQEINDYLNKKYNRQKDHVIIIDTDSNFICLSDYVNNKEDTITLANELQLHINEQLNNFSNIYLNLNGRKHYFEMKREIIAKSGLSVAKKRYAMRVIDIEGMETDELKIKGINIVRSDFPIYFKEMFKNIILKILDEYTYEQIKKEVDIIKDNMNTTSIFDVSIPTGVKNINKFIDTVNRYKKGATVYAKACINYNLLLKEYKLDTTYEPIHEGEKIKFIYLRDNINQFESIAFKEEIPEKILNYIGTSIDYDKIFNSVMTKKLNTIYSILEWPLIEIKKKKNKK